MTNEIPKELIQASLALCDKSLKDMITLEVESWANDISKEFSYPKFFYYLLSPEFIDKYYEYDNVGTDRLSQVFGEAIWCYQSGDSESIISLLSKIDV